MIMNIIAAAAEGSTHGPPNSFWDAIGTFPLILAIIAVAIGASHAIIRSREWAIRSLILEAALAACGVVISCWRLYMDCEIPKEHLGDYGYPDLVSWLTSFAWAASALGAVLAGVAIGLILIALGMPLKKNVAEQVAASDR